MSIETKIADKQVSKSVGEGSYTINVLGSEILISRFHDRQGIAITATTSEQLPHCYLENWLSEPFNILFGSPVFPRLVSRNLNNGSSFISLRKSNSYKTRFTKFSLLAGHGELETESFWELYKRLLIFIAKSRDKEGGLNFEANPLTVFYREIVQASKASNWVLCFTLASAIEGLMKMLKEPEKNFSVDDIRNIKKYIKGYDGNKKLKESLLNMLGYFSQKSIYKMLVEFSDQSILNKDDVKVWSKIRNSVMHGELSNPWFDEDEYNNMHSLLRIVHKLTFKLLN